MPNDLEKEIAKREIAKKMPDGRRYLPGGQPRDPQLKREPSKPYDDEIALRELDVMLKTALDPEWAYAKDPAWGDNYIHTYRGPVIQETVDENGEAWQDWVYPDYYDAQDHALRILNSSYGKEEREGIHNAAIEQAYKDEPTFIIHPDSWKQLQKPRKK